MMNKLLCIVLSLALLLTGCAAPTSKQDDEVVVLPDTKVEFNELNNPELLTYLENDIYDDLVVTLNNENYFVENVQALYVSKEYLEELEYNSKSNIYFGYTLDELNQIFDGTKYVFSFENGKTVVKEFEAYDDTYDKVIRNVAIGTGVILICVTVSIISGGVGASAVSLVFATSAKTGTAVALSDSVFSGAVSAVVTGVETKDLEKTIDAAALSASEGFMWGAFGGTIIGGVKGVNQVNKLKGATLNGLTLNEAAKIQMDSKYPAEIIKNFHSFDEYQVYKASNLKSVKVNGKLALTQDIDWDFVGDIEDGRTNAQRVLDGLAPLDASGKSYEVHHIGQKADSPFAILTSDQHKKNYSTIHHNTGGQASEIDRNAFSKEKQEFWLSLLNNK